MSPRSDTCCRLRPAGAHSMSLRTSHAVARKRQMGRQACRLPLRRDCPSYRTKVGRTSLAGATVRDPHVSSQDVEATPCRLVLLAGRGGKRHHVSLARTATGARCALDVPRKAIESRTAQRGEGPQSDTRGCRMRHGHAAMGHRGGEPEEATDRFAAVASVPSAPCLSRPPSRNGKRAVPVDVEPHSVPGAGRARDGGVSSK